VLTLRFDMRVPAWAGSAADLYAAAIDMCEWAESRGAFLAILSEHHGATDGHLPSPLLLAAALAARTSTLAILIAAVPIPLCDPVRLAEEVNVLDLISRGRVSYAFGIGHRAEEYEHFGVDFADRGRLADDYVAAVVSLLRGAAADVSGRRVQVRPAGTSPSGPTVLIAGGSRPAVRRAARHGLGFIAQTDGLKEYYEERCRAAGHTPGFFQQPVTGAPTALFVADDLDAAWVELGPHLLHDARMAASYRHGDDSVASITRAERVEQLRAEGGPYRIVSRAEAAAMLREGRPLPLHPLCGGIEPATAQRYLESAVAAVEMSRT
jgi:alkanesulfonate monooxygenase SsuD/methylene tetrahydromethanopterin reductase-like flavin-dependent oxidoreductase (luciferase family)